MKFEWEIRVPAVANATGDWNTPADSGEIEWAGTAHGIGRGLLAIWQEEAEGPYSGEPAVIQVRSDEGITVTIDSTADVTETIAVLEAAIERKQAADIASDRARDELADAMEMVREFDGLSKNNIAHMARHVVSRPTALKMMKDD
jgi:hypothetical protein